MAPPSSTHVQLDDVPRTPIQPSVEGEFRQHDGVVVVEDRGNPAGLLQAPRERRRERGRAAPELRV